MVRFFVLACLLTGQLIVAQPLLYQPHHIDRQIPGCGDPKNGCTHAALDWIEVTTGPDVVRDRINAAVMDALLARPGSAPAATPEQFVTDFLNAEQKADTSLDGPSWWTKTVKVLRAAPPVFSLQFSESFYHRGAAHPSANTEFLNFDANTGDKATLAAVVVEGGLPRLTQIAEAAFRKARTLAPDEDLKQAGFIFFKGDRFYLNDNWGLTEDSLIFYYNDYEVAPYYMGPTEVKIPFSEIKDILRPGFVK